jgi:hypothetical protein
MNRYIVDYDKNSHFRIRETDVKDNCIEELKLINNYYCTYRHFFLVILSYLTLRDKCREIEYYLFENDYNFENISKDKQYFKVKIPIRWDTELEMSTINLILLSKTYIDLINKDVSLPKNTTENYHIKLIRYLRNQLQHNVFHKLWVSCGYSYGFNIGGNTTIAIRKEAFLQDVTDEEFKKSVKERESEMIFLDQVIDEFIRNLCVIHQKRRNKEDKYKIGDINNIIKTYYTDDIGKFNAINLYQSKYNKNEFSYILSKRYRHKYKLLNQISAHELLSIHFVYFGISQLFIRNIRKPKLFETNETLGFENDKYRIYE